MGAEEFIPEHASITALRTAVQGCRGCDLYRDATQAVFGKRRIHQSPARIEIVACRPWLLAEFRLLDPDLVVIIGPYVKNASNTHLSCSVSSGVIRNPCVFVSRSMIFG